MRIVVGILLSISSAKAFNIDSAGADTNTIIVSKTFWGVNTNKIATIDYVNNHTSTNGVPIHGTNGILVTPLGGTNYAGLDPSGSGIVSSVTVSNFLYNPRASAPPQVITAIQLWNSNNVTLWIEETNGVSSIIGSGVLGRSLYY